MWNSSIHVFSFCLTLICVFLFRTLLWTLLGGATWLKWANEAYIWINLRWCPLFNLDKREGPKCTTQEETWHILHYQYHSEQIHLMVRDWKSATGLEKGLFGCCMSQWLLLLGSSFSLPAAQELCISVLNTNLPEPELCVSHSRAFHIGWILENATSSDAH